MLLTPRWRSCAAFVLAVFVLLGSGCARLPPRPQLAQSDAIPAGKTTVLDSLFTPMLKEHPGKSGFRLVPDGVQAFVLLALAARSAGRSLDLQSYIWHDDLTGRLLASELLKAADRGVRVRLLIDDLSGRKNNAMLAALDYHPNISVRLFNPFASRSGAFQQGAEMLFHFSRINHRMHNKAWIADNRLAIAGGRNIGDEYFQASEQVNFSDLDLAMSGPVVQELSASFDRYWNSQMAWPIATVSPADVNDTALANLRASSEAYETKAEANPWIVALPQNEAIKELKDLRHGHLDMQWTSQWQVLADSPTKAFDSESPLLRSQVAAGLVQQILAAQSAIEFISPYFIPGKNGSSMLIGAAHDGRSVKILTNSLASNDVVSVHGGYAKYRPALLKGGVQLWELKPNAKQARSSLFGSSGASLHGKAAVFDNATSFVGSFNLDPRSVSLNCEQGVLVTDPVIAGQLTHLFQVMTSPSNAWRVEENASGHLLWTDGIKTWDREPDASLGKRTAAKIAGWLPVEAQL